jgi:DNA-binding GntR family transcriptional regulator
VERWQPEYETRLHQIVDEMRQAGKRGDLQQIYELDYDFHFTIWKIADHGLLLEVISSLRSRISRFLYEANGALYDSQADLLSQHINGHDKIVNALMSGNITYAQDVITAHVLGAKERILTYCKLPS